MSKKMRLLAVPLLLLCGALAALPLVFGALFFLSWIAIAPPLALLFSHPRVRLRRAYGGGLLFFAGYYLVAWHGLLAMYPLEMFGFSSDTALAVVLFAWIALSLFQAAASAFAAVLLAVTARGAKAWLFPLLAGASWVIFDYPQTLTWAGVPWARLAIGQCAIPAVIQIASVFGTYGVSFLMVAVNALLAMAAVHLFREKQFVLRSPAARCAIVAVLLFLANFTFGAVCMALPATGETVTVSIIQGAISSRDKWGEGGYAISCETYTALTAKAAVAGAELIVWPETAFNYDITYTPAIARDMQAIAENAGVPLLASSFKTEEDGTFYNCVFHLDGAAWDDTVYRKQKLVPFGEFVPMQAFFTAIFPPITELATFTDDITAGTESAVFQTAAGNVGALVCFDSLYDALARESVRNGAELLTISTNDSWFGDSAALTQHRNHAILRAVETGRSVVRAANTGVSAIISPNGEILAELAEGEQDIANASVPIRTSQTLYTRLGNVLPLACALLAAAVLLLKLKKR